MWPNPLVTADLVTFTQETFNGKFHFLCSTIYAQSDFALGLWHPEQKTIEFPGKMNFFWNCFFRYRNSFTFFKTLFLFRKIKNDSNVHIMDKNIICLINIFNYMDSNNSDIFFCYYGKLSFVTMGNSTVNLESLSFFKETFKKDFRCLWFELKRRIW